MQYPLSQTRPPAHAVPLALEFLWHMLFTTRAHAISLNLLTRLITPTYAVFVLFLAAYDTSLGNKA